MADPKDSAAIPSDPPASAEAYTTSGKIAEPSQLRPSWMKNFSSHATAMQETLGGQLSQRDAIMQQSDGTFFTLAGDPLRKNDSENLLAGASKSAVGMAADFSEGVGDRSRLHGRSTALGIEAASETAHRWNNKLTTFAQARTFLGALNFHPEGGERSTRLNAGAEIGAVTQMPTPFLPLWRGGMNIFTLGGDHTELQADAGFSTLGHHERLTLKADLASALDHMVSVFARCNVQHTTSEAVQYNHNRQGCGVEWDFDGNKVLGNAAALWHAIHNRGR